MRWMRVLLVLLGSVGSGCGNGSSEAEQAGGDAGAVDGRTGADGLAGDAAGGDGAAPGCMAGETTCGSACIVGSDCGHAAVPDPLTAASVWLNGGTYVVLGMASASDVVGARVADAVVGSYAIDSKHLRIEVPPGVAGAADVTVSVKGGSSVTTKRALTYASAPEGTTWTKKTMSMARGGYPGMTTTMDGRAIVAGGYTDPSSLSNCTNTADLFERASQQATPAANTMATKRWTADAVTLLDGRTIIAGGCYVLGSCTFDSQEIDFFTPQNNTFSPAKGRLSIPRSYLRSVRLADGRVLFASDDTPSFDVFDPVADAVTQVAGGTFSSPAPLDGWMARMRDGRVLVVPGNDVANSIYDPASGTFTPTGDSLPQYPDALVPVGDGRIFAVGGFTLTTQSGQQDTTATDAIDVWDPTTNKFSPWAKLATPRWASTVILARDGRIYVIAGLSGYAKYGASCANPQDFAQATFLSSVEVIDPGAQAVGSGPALPEANLSLGSTILFDGSIIAGGGTTCGTNATSYPSVYFLQAPQTQ